MILHFTVFHLCDGSDHETNPQIKIFTCITYLKYIDILKTNVVQFDLVHDPDLIQIMCAELTELN